MRRSLTRMARVAGVAVFVTWVFLVSWSIGATTRAQAASAVDTPASALPAPELDQRSATPRTSVDEVSRTVMCPSCDTTLDQSDSPAAERMRVWITAAVAAGWTKDEIRSGLVREYGGDESILATPRAAGLGWAVWIVPGIVALGGLLTVVVLLRRWRRQSVYDTSQASVAPSGVSDQPSPPDAPSSAPPAASSFT